MNTLNQQELVNLGLNQNQFSVLGSHIFGVQFAKAGLPTGDFITSLLLNCNNDGVVSYFQRSVEPPKSTPEPSAILGLMLLLGGFYSAKKVSKLSCEQSPDFYDININFTLTAKIISSRKNQSYSIFSHRISSRRTKFSSRIT